MSAPPRVSARQAPTVADGPRTTGGAARLRWAPECLWFGISRDADGSHVTGLTLIVNNLSGSLPSFDGLPVLEVINLSFNTSTGTIPSLAHLPSLKSFDAQSNALSGPIPSLTGSSIWWACVWNTNKLTRPIPPLSGLTYLFQITLRTTT